MANSVRVKLALKFILVAANLCFLVIYVSGWTVPLIQSNKKSIVRRISYSKYPVDISFELKGQPLTSKETVLAGRRSNDFDADGDWVKDLTIKIRNTSDKTITWMLVNLLFPEVTKDGSMALHQIFLGVDPDAPFPRPELRLQPHQTLTIPLNAKYDDIKHLVNVIGSGMPIEGVSKMEVEFHAALFDDDTRFETGTMFRRNSDPTDPQKWIKIED
ncbi:MAG: hypothetical protein QOH71_3863 [Blastocatellia bacterium]|nr:hypothetical protein [Blastocatellia bacterium]